MGTHPVNRRLALNTNVTLSFPAVHLAELARQHGYGEPSTAKANLTLKGGSLGRDANLSADTVRRWRGEQLGPRSRRHHDDAASVRLMVRFTTTPPFSLPVLHAADTRSSSSIFVHQSRLRMSCRVACSFDPEYNNEGTLHVDQGRTVLVDPPQSSCRLIKMPSSLPPSDAFLRSRT